SSIRPPTTRASNNGAISPKACSTAWAQASGGSHRSAQYDSTAQSSSAASKRTRVSDAASILAPPAQIPAPLFDDATIPSKNSSPATPSTSASATPSDRFPGPRLHILLGKKVQQYILQICSLGLKQIIAKTKHPALHRPNHNL